MLLEVATVARKSVMTMVQEPEAIVELRRALGERLATYRKLAGLTQGELGRKLYCDRTNIVRLEQGERSKGQQFWREADDLLETNGVLVTAFTKLEATKRNYERQKLEAQLAGLREQTDVWREAQPTTEQEAFDPMRRRTLVKLGLTAAVTAAGLGSVGTISNGDVLRLERATARLHSLDQQHGGETLWQAAISPVNDGYRMLEQGTYSETVGHQLLKTTGRLQICAGWLAFDAGQHDVARTCYTEALVLARQSNDAEVETRALANLAFQSNVLGRPREALRFATAAKQAATAPGSEPRLAAIPQLRLAIASALMQDATDTDQAVTRARKSLDKDTDAPTQEWNAFLSPVEIDAVEATCAIELKRAAKAETLLEQAIAGYGNQYARNRALYRVRLAQARLAAHTVDGAVESASAALDDLGGDIASWRVSAELDAVACELAKYPNVPGVDNFLHRYADIDHS